MWFYLLGDISGRGTNLFLQGDGSAGNQSNNSQSSSYANYIVSAGAGVGGGAGVTSIGGRTANIGDNAISLNQIASIGGGGDEGSVTSSGVNCIQLVAGSIIDRDSSSSRNIVVVIDSLQLSTIVSNIAVQLSVGSSRQCPAMKKVSPCLTSTLT